MALFADRSRKRAAAALPRGISSLERHLQIQHKVRGGRVRAGCAGGIKDAVLVLERRGCSRGDHGRLPVAAIVGHGHGVGLDGIGHQTVAVGCGAAIESGPDGRDVRDA